LTQIKSEGQSLHDAIGEKENSSESSPETTGNDQTGSSDQDQTQTENKDGIDRGAGLADDPRWVEREKDWKNRFNTQESRHLEDITKLREELMGKIGGPEITQIDIPTWWGGDESQWKQFVEWNQDLLKGVEENALKRITTAQTEEQKKIDEATTYFQEQMSAIESDKAINPQGEKIDRNKLLKFVLDNELVDTKGRWNYRAGYLMMRGGLSSKIVNTADRKGLANATTSDKGAETRLPAFMTSSDFKKPGARPW